MGLRHCVCSTVLAAASLPAMVGCSSFKSPALTIGDARIANRSSEAVRFDVRVTLENPNREAIGIRQVKYTASINGATAYRGRRAAQLTLGPGLTQHLVLPVIVGADQAAAAGATEAKWSISGEVLYTTPGEIAELLLDTGVRRPTLRFSERGTINLAGPVQTVAAPH